MRQLFYFRFFIIALGDFMKNILRFGLHILFWITSLLFLPKSVSIYVCVFLISVFCLQNPIDMIFPLALCFWFPISETCILLGVVLIHFLLLRWIKKNRFYAFTVFVFGFLTVFLTQLLQKQFQMNLLEPILLLGVVYSCINLLYSYQTFEQKNNTIAYHQNLVYLCILLAYFVLFLRNRLPLSFILFLFMQLFLFKDAKYLILFAIFYAVDLLIESPSSCTDVLAAVAVGFVPPGIFLTFSYSSWEWIFLGIYTIVLTFFPAGNKTISVEADYIDSLFRDFAKYLQQLSAEFRQNNEQKILNNQKINDLSQTYCDHCYRKTLCKAKPDRRYSFIYGAMQGLNQNIYDCPNYHRFYSPTDWEIKSTATEYSGIRALADEINHLYHQSLLLKKEYQKLIRLLEEFGYEVLNIDINLSCETLFFTIDFSKQKIIIESLLLRLAYKSFGEELELKIVPNDKNIRIYFYKKPLLKISYAHTVIAKNENLMSGDNYYIKKDFNSSYIFALSDGMGSGYQAYMESANALKTISLLSSYHFSMKTILHLLEDVCDLKRNYDHYATLDFLYINTANQKMHLYKMGSTTTYILHNHQLKALENRSLPLHLDEVNSSFELDLSSGDYIFLLSDGISDFISKDEFYDLVRSGTESTEALCNKIVQYMEEKEQRKLKDDLSLIAIKAI